MATPPPTPPALPSESDGPRPIAVLHGFVLLLFWTQALWLWARLPARIPVHFGGDGLPDRWLHATPLAWLALPLTGTALSGLVWGIGRWAATVPRLWNVPEKERFLALSPQARAPIVGTVRGFLDGVGILTIVFFDLIQWWTYRTAVGAVAGLPRLFSLFIGLVVVAAVLASALLYVRLQRQILEASAATWPRRA